MPTILALVSFRIFPTLMGGQKGVAAFYRHLPLPVILAASIDNEGNAFKGMQLILFPNRMMPRNISRIPGLKRIMQEKKVDIILAEHSYTGWIAWMLSRSTGKPFIIHSHNIESRRFQQMNKWWWKIYHRYEGWIHRKAKHNFFISDEDRDYALNKFRLNPGSCSVITYGVERRPPGGDRKEIRKSLQLDPFAKIYLFNGTLDYKPNYDAVVTIVKEIEPLLAKRTTNFQILVTGNRAPSELIRLMEKSLHIRYLGYVADVNLYYRAADLFMNPVSNDTGVKTKLIEAIANNCTAISTRSGASGIKKEFCGNKLILAENENWEKFVDAIVNQSTQTQNRTPEEFYEFYDWKNITAKAARIITQAAS